MRAEVLKSTATARRYHSSGELMCSMNHPPLARKEPLAMKSDSTTPGTLWSLHATRQAPGAWARPPRIIVVGAGMAGLVCARLLHDSGCTVTVLEARARLGGRLWTETRLGVPTDLGASWIHGADHNPLSTWCRAIGLPLAFAPTGSRRFYADGAFMRTPALARKTWRGLVAAAAAAGRAQWQARRTAVPASLGSVMEPLIANPRLPPLDRRFLAWITSMSESVEGAPAERIDIAHWYPGEANGVNALPVGGYGRLVADAATGLALRCETPVRVIRYTRTEVTVETANELFTADAVVVTVPLGILKDDVIRFEPPLPAPKRAAIARLGFGGDAVMNKIVLRFDKQFWPDTNERSIVLPAQPDERGRYTNWINVAQLLKAPVIMGFASGRAAAMLEHSYDDAASVELALANLARLTGTQPPAPTGVIVTRWLSDPWARGAYSYNSVHSSDADRLDYARPVGDRVYFAGEGTQAVDYGTVQAALRSGVDAASAIFRHWAGMEPTLANAPWHEAGSAH